MKCKACGYEGEATRFSAREMMFGLRERFDYEKCPSCGSLQIAAVPADLGRFYPGDYYSFSAQEADSRVSAGRRMLAGLILASPWAVALARPLRSRYPFLWWTAIAGKRQDSSCLDVGCGSGRLLRRMRKAGFTRLAGVDPFAPGDVDEPGLTIQKAEIDSVTGTYDFIVLSHVLEHLVDPGAALRTVRRLLSPGGVALVRIPVAGSAAAERYGADWFNLDPPRHLLIPSVAGMRLLAEKSGLAVRTVEFDSQEDSLLMSENYRQDIPMMKAPKADRTVRRMRRREAEALNRAGTGDLAAYFLVPRA